jgi:hypothetical protein
MGVRICEGDDATFLYDSVTTRPINTEAFESLEAAESFVLFSATKGIADLRAAPSSAVEMLHTEWLGLPMCEECGGHGVCPDWCTKDEDVLLAASDRS